MTKYHSAESGQTQSTNMLDVYDLKRFSCASLGGRYGVITLNHPYDPKDPAEYCKIISVYVRCLCFKNII